MKRVLAVLFFGLSICLMLSGCIGWLLPTPKASATYSGTLVDGATGRPLEGAVIIATWHNFTPAYFGPVRIEGGPNYSCYQLVNVETAVSGPDGHFELPGWVGKLGHCQSMNLWQPNVVYYKPGYAVFASGYGDDEYTPGSDYTATGSDQGVIKMAPLGHHQSAREDDQVGNLDQYAIFIQRALGEDEHGPCFWKESAPALLMLFQDERRLSNYAPGGMSFVERDAMGAIQYCADPKAMAALRQQAQSVQPE